METKLNGGEIKNLPDASLISFIESVLLKQIFTTKLQKKEEDKRIRILNLPAKYRSLWERE